MKFLRRWIYLLVALPLLVGCSKKKDPKDKADFEMLMGKEMTERWQYVQTPEDFENLKFFKTVYDKNISFLHAKSTMFHVPKVIHFIWIGPKPFPRDSVENVRSWVAKHPDWTFKFWTDRDRPLPHKQMQRARIQDLQFIKLYDCYKKSDNYAEKSDLLRLEILYQEGGIYVDHDQKCFRSFEPLNKAYDFYCGMELPYKTSLSSSVLPTNNLLGSRPGHILLKQQMDWLVDNWDRIGNEYPGTDRDSVINRVSHRTFVV
ncbi:MAG TPA: glycosyltransferase, partial [Candidatus Babeliaceae bacterium]|nr:glycosyltransferase [Candidatus Babeliaceae bacterium]